MWVRSSYLVIIYPCYSLLYIIVYLVLLLISNENLLYTNDFLFLFFAGSTGRSIRGEIYSFVWRTCAWKIIFELFQVFITDDSAIFMEQIQCSELQNYIKNTHVLMKFLIINFTVNYDILSTCLWFNSSSEDNSISVSLFYLMVKKEGLPKHINIIQ